MTGGDYRLTRAVLLTGSAVEVARYAVAAAQRARRRNGLPPVASLANLAAIFDSALSPGGHLDTVGDETEQPDYMTTTEAAALLDCTERTVRRQAGELGGRKLGGRWFVDRQAVAEHIEGRHCA